MIVGEAPAEALEVALDEGVAPLGGLKFAINGWMRSKNLRAARGY